MKSEVKFIYNRFSDFFCEAVYFADAASKPNLPEDIPALFSKTSILSCVFALESAANSLIAELNLFRSTENDFDRLPVVGKFELFYLAHTNKREFDRGCKEVQAIRDLIRFRDNQVHSKLHEHILKTDASNHLKYPDIQYTTYLNIPLIPYFLSHEHSISALKAVDDFLEKFLFEWCGLSVYETSAILLHRQSIDLKNDNPVLNCPLTTPIVSTVENTMNEMNLRFRYIDRQYFKGQLTHRK